MPEFLCPRCPDSTLKPVDVEGRRALQCERCHGHSVSVSVIRASADKADFQVLWRSALSQATPGQVPCAGCRRPMQAIALTISADRPPVEVDLCKTCQLFWFDPTERQAVVELAPPPTAGRDEIPLEAKRLMAMEKVRLDNERQRTRMAMDRLDDPATVVEIGAGVTETMGLLVRWWKALID